MKLEGARRAGYRTVCIAGIRCPTMIQRIDPILADVRKRIDTYFDGADPFTLLFHLYGKDAVMGPPEARAHPLPHELGLVTEVMSFWTITWPLGLPGVIAGAVIVFTLSMSAYVTPSVLGGGKVKVLAMLVFEQFYIQYNVDPLIAAVSAATIYLALLIVILIDVTVGLERFAVPRA